MKKQHLILITAGIIIGVLIFGRKNRAPSPVNVIKPGDKGNDIYGLQYALTGITGIKLGNMGVYDNETLAAVQYYMNGTNALENPERGYVNRNFASDLFSIMEQAKKSN